MEHYQAWPYQALELRLDLGFGIQLAPLKAELQSSAPVKLSQNVWAAKTPKHDSLNLETSKPEPRERWGLSQGYNVLAKADLHPGDPGPCSNA